MLGREERHERPEIVAKCHAEVGHRSRLDRQQRRPPKEEPPQRTEGLFEVVILPARLRKHGSQFGVAQCAGYRDQATGDPGEQHQRGMGDLAGHEGGRDEDGGAQDGSRRDCGHLPQPQRPVEARGFRFAYNVLFNCRQL